MAGYSAVRAHQELVLRTMLYVHEHHRLGFGMLTVETAVAFVDLVPVATEKVSLIRSNIVWNRRRSTLRARSIKVNLNNRAEM